VKSRFTLAVYDFFIERYYSLQGAIEIHRNYSAISQKSLSVLRRSYLSCFGSCTVL